MVLPSEKVSLAGIRDYTMLLCPSVQNNLIHFNNVLSYTNNITNPSLITQARCLVFSN